MNVLKRKSGRIVKKMGYIIRRISLITLQRRILKNKRKGKEPIAILGPMFYKSNGMEGYIQRIKSVDQNAMSSLYRVYLCDNGPKAKRIKAFYVDKEHVEISFNGLDPAQCEKVEAIIDLCAKLYAHSVYKIINEKGALLSFFKRDNVIKVWDVHGAVPEECLLYGKEKLHVHAEKAEAYAYAHADVIITLNQEMKEHLRKKHGVTKARFLEIPYFAGNGLKIKHACPKGDGEKLVVIYAGGTQPWQNVERIKKLVKETNGMYEYRFFVPDPKQFRKQWDLHAEEIIIDCVPPHRMGKAYEGCHYGLLFRDDIPVNNVACPAKLIEYMQNGIVPVLINDRIGGFASLGMQFVSYESFAKGKIPSEEERERIAESNRQVLTKLENIAEKGYEEMRRMLMGLKTTGFYNKTTTKRNEVFL